MKSTSDKNYQYALLDGDLKALEVTVDVMNIYNPRI